MKNILLITLTLSALLASCNRPQTEQKSPLLLQLDSLITSEHEAMKFDGTVVIGTKDTVLFEKAIGTSNRVWDIPMRMDHRFDICSVNKSFVALLIMAAVEEGKLSLEDRLVDLVDTMAYSGKFDPNITIHQMLSHTSGLPDYDQSPSELTSDGFKMLKRQHFTPETYVDFISQMPAINGPGKQFYYSNYAYHLLIILLEQAYLLPFPELLNQKVSEPLGLKHTFSTTSNEQVFKNSAEGYNYQQDTDTWNRNQFIDLTIGRRIFSTAKDLYLWGKEMSAATLITPESMSLIQTNHLEGINSNISYGYGWVVFDGKGKYRMGDLGIDKKYIIHGGATEGFKAMLINIENGEYIIAILANTGRQTNEMELAQKIVNILINIQNEN